MKIFIINLEKESKKREKIKNECEKLKLNFELYNAVDGNSLSDSFIHNTVYDYPNNFLTKAEIGCALSHINIYKKIIQDNLPYALILEDDAVLDNKLPDFLNSFKTKNTKKGIFLLTADFHYLVNKKFNLDNFELFEVTKAVRANGYIITNEAAKKLIKFLFPIRYEADMFKIIKACTGVKLYATLPCLISTNDKNLLNSSIQAERTPLIKQRSEYRKKLFKKDKKKRMIALWVKKQFISRFEKTNYYTD
ncbi:MAG: glycosyltransferase family 25 protein [Gilliamella sp.]|uniref:Glycosyl transferase, family 25 n=1 Tax=Gilliamella intestini TaxID=1798183 RepID=A0A1C4D388_9GAMM|nr:MULTISPECIES: glycosyltransferase family 25 protein [Gilliamella]MCO6552041.1 glycosyltransferase family 25 protein [Gilliamella sp.]OCG36217.1 hypothetical protein A9G31_00660 [Gilliamella apicola]OCG68439.1 hypothetical protein A9G39_02865 [Gilliamella apicola]SCC25720.1 glycosyl transferase, family 25 [Gilliamella intestini]